MKKKNTKGNLLIVDDEELLTETLCLFMEGYADNVYTANNGEQALKTLEEQDIHCVICDINMPGMNGVEVIKEMRSRGYEKPFIFYTGHGSEKLMMEVVKYGAFDFLNKPSFEGLEDTVSRGLKEGLTGKGSDPELDKEVFISEYQKILSDLGKIK